MRLKSPCGGLAYRFSKEVQNKAGSCQQALVELRNAWGVEVFERVELIHSVIASADCRYLDCKSNFSRRSHSHSIFMADF